MTAATATADDLLIELKKLSTDAKNGMEALRSENQDTVKNVETKFFKKYDDLKADYDSKIAEYKSAVTNAEAKMAAAIKDAEEAKGSAKEIDKRLQELEVKLAQGLKNQEDDPRATEEYKSVMNILGAQVNSWQPLVREAIEKKMLRTEPGQAGGFLIPEVMDTQIRKKVTEISPVRLVAPTRVLPGKSMSVPIRDALMDSWYEGEGEPAQESNSKYGSEEITTYRHTAVAKVTYDMLIATPFNLEAEIASDAAEAFAKKEGARFLKGTGNKEPQGILMDPRIETVTSAASGVLSFDDIAELISRMKTGYMGILGFNRQTLGTIRKLKDTLNRPLWTPVTDGAPAAVWGEPYTDKFIDMDAASAGSNAVPIVYADWQRGYEIFDTTGMMVVRDDITGAANSVVRYIFRRWNTARVLLPEAIKLLKVQ